MMGARLGHLIDTHAAALTLFARQWCAAAEEVVQDAFLKLASRGDIPDERVAAWLYGVTRNLARTARRAEERRRRHEHAAAAQKPAWFVPDEPTGLDAQAVAEALAALPLEEREVIVAHLWGGLTFAQIGPLIESSPATAHRRFVAGIDQLRRRLESPCPTPISIPAAPR